MIGKTKKVITVFLCVIIAALPAFSTFAASGDEVRSAKKIISVVYDDSGSMKGDRWVYASYATQALIALLNEQDELYVTFMTHPSKAVHLDTSDVEGAVKTIRELSESGDTPASSIDTAAAVLDEYNESDVSAQFWLMLMTDGEFNDLTQDLQDKLNSYKGKTMSNGSELNTVYVAMGAGAKNATEDPSKGLYTFETKNNQEILTTISQVANLISGRIPADDVKAIDGKTIQFSSSLPLYSISVLSQNSNASVVSAKTSEKELNVVRNVSLDAYDVFDKTTLNIKGNAAVINSSTGGAAEAIPKDTYVVTFSENVDVSSLVVQYEPAIGIKMVVSRNGVDIDDYQSNVFGDVVDITLLPVVAGTDDQIPDADMPSSVKWRVEHELDGKLTDEADSNKLMGVKIEEGKHLIRGTMQIKGFAPLLYEIDFDIVDPYKNLGIDVNQPDAVSYLRRNISAGSESGEEVVFTITSDGVPLTKDQLKSGNISLVITGTSIDNHSIPKINKGVWEAVSVLKQNDDGSYTLKPTGAASFFAYMIKSGEYTVNVALSSDGSITAVGVYSIVPGPLDWLWLIFLAVLILLIIYFVLVLTKSRFKNQNIRYEVYRIRDDEIHGVRGYINNGLTDTKRLSSRLRAYDFLHPFERACTADYWGLHFTATKSGAPVVSGASIRKLASFYGISGLDPHKKMSGILRNLQKTEEESGASVVNDTILDKQRLFFRDSDRAKTVWCIFIV